MGSQLRVFEQEVNLKHLANYIYIFLLFRVENKETSTFKIMMHFLATFIMTAFVVFSSTELAECSPMDKNLDDLKSFYDQSRGDDSGWIKGKTCWGHDYGFVAHKEDGDTLKDLATAKKDCAEACDKNVGYTLAYYNQTCKYASLLFKPDTQICYLSSSEWCWDEPVDKLNFYLYTKQ